MPAALSPLMTVMHRAAEKASRSLLRDFGEVENLQVSRKGPGDFVTAADKRAEQIIHDELAKTRPDFSFMMEEGGEIKGSDPDHKWIIDPLDGTHNFMHGVPHWSISIALEQRGQIVAGLVYDCTKDEMFIAEKGTGAFMRNKRLRVSGRNVMELCMFNYGQPFKDPVKNELFFKELRAVSGAGAMVRRFASAALDLCYVSAGRIDGYWERHIKAWDVAAGILILKEAGGLSTPIDHDDNPVYSNQIVAGNAAMQGELRKILKSAA